MQNQNLHQHYLEEYQNLVQRMLELESIVKGKGDVRSGIKDKELNEINGYSQFKKIKERSKSMGMRNHSMLANVCDKKDLNLMR